MVLYLLCVLPFQLASNDFAHFSDMGNCPCVKYDFYHKPLRDNQWLKNFETSDNLSVFAIWLIVCKTKSYMQNNFHKVSTVDEYSELNSAVSLNR